MASNIRNITALGGVALLDLGVYLVGMTRFMFEAEPTRALSLLERDPVFGTDRLVSFLLEFPQGQASFVCSTQLGLNQRIIALGTLGQIDVETPFTPAKENDTRLLIAASAREGAPLQDTIEIIPAVDQYACQFEAFAAAVARERAPVVALAIPHPTCALLPLSLLPRATASGSRSNQESLSHDQIRTECE
jgi:predicted dehydrogenase